jgi:hypothetical protein
VKPDHKELLAEITSNSAVKAAIIALLDDQIQRLERAVLDFNLATEADLWKLAQLKADLEGARKVRAGAIAYINSLRSVSR